MQPRQTLLVAVFGLGSLVLMTSGATAEWLVTRDGSQVEINGPWKVTGKLVTFTLPNGTLGSMPLAEVDLEGSHALAAQAAAKNEEVPAEPARRKAVMVITDADVGHPRLPSAASSDEAATAPAASSSEAPELRVAGWRETVDPSRTTVGISGTLLNPTQNPATSIELEVQLYDNQGGLLESSTARLERWFLNPGATTRFDAYFNDTLSYDRVEFHIRSRGFMADPPEDEPADEDQDEGDDTDEDQAG